MPQIYIVGRSSDAPLSKVFYLSFSREKLFCKNCERTVNFEIVSAFELRRKFFRIMSTTGTNSVLSA